MNFIDVIPTVFDAISEHPTFSDLAATTVFIDLGTASDLIEQALQDQARGYAIAVWPPARGSASDEAAGRTGSDNGIVVQFSTNPSFLKNVGTLREQAVWLTTRISDIIGAVLDLDPEAGGVKFQLAADPFELMAFDEGLIIYHIRFIRFSVF